MARHYEGGMKKAFLLPLALLACDGATPAPSPKSAALYHASFRGAYQAGVYEGVIVRERVVLASGVILTRSTPVFDLTNEKIYKSDGSKPLEIPAGAVVVQGSRQITSGFGKENGLSLYAPIIVKYRDERTDAATKLEDYLR